jgi:hypothetical protein
VQVLSAGLLAAGDPVSCPEGHRVLFAGKKDKDSPWQIYEARMNGGAPRRLTSAEGGAMNPSVMAGGDLVYSSPVPGETIPAAGERLPALFAQSSGQLPRRLTWGTRAAQEPVVMADGRILFITAKVGSLNDSAAADVALFTINNDGTEFSRFAIDHDGASLVRRPRELKDGRVAFLAGDPCSPTRPEIVQKGRPFLSRKPLWDSGPAACTSFETAGEQGWLACLANQSNVLTAGAGVSDVYFIPPGGPVSEIPCFRDPQWSTVEAVLLAPRPSPMGHMSAIDPTKNRGTLLCLDANFTRAKEGATNPSVRVRVLAAESGGTTRSLGEVDLQADGSFMVEVPADTPLGFESLDARGQVRYRLAPSVWVRPGENRSCIGCHEPYNRSPRNHRPLAAALAPIVLGEEKHVATKP